MKTSGKVMLTVTALASASLAQAAPLRPIQATCLGMPNAVSRAAAEVGERRITAGGCCDGQLRCSQFLATTTAVRPPVKHRS